MATDEQITDLNNLAAPANTDLVVIERDPVGTPETTKAEVQNVIRLGHGKLSVSGNTTAQVLSAATWATIDAWDTAVDGANVDADHSNNDIELTNAGWYEAVLFVRAAMASAETVKFRLRWNGADQDYLELPHTTSGTEDFDTIIRATINASVASANLIAQVHSLGGANITVKEALLHVNRIG